MRLTVWIPEEGTLELNYMWLPTFIGMNTVLKKEIEEHIAPYVVGKEFSDKLQLSLDSVIMDFIFIKCPIPGLREYIQALRNIDDTQRDEQG